MNGFLAKSRDDDLKTLTIFIPVFNEVENIPLLEADMNRLSKHFEDRTLSLEVLIHDNASTDLTWRRIENWVNSSNLRIRACKFRRNLGYQESLTLACRNASGDAFIVYQSDRQDPLEIIFELVSSWAEGNKVTVGIASNRAENILEKLGRKVFVWILGKSSDIASSFWFTDFYCLDKTVYLQIGEFPLMHQFVRGRILELFEIDKAIYYSRNKRLVGTSKFKFKQRYRLAIDALLLQGSRIIRKITLFGLFSTSLLFVLCLGYVVVQTLQPNPKGVLIAIGALVFFTFAAMFMTILGFILEYLIRIYRRLHASQMELFGTNQVEIELRTSNFGVVR
jgi:glycosyltransferase involved in cell wall biosynthesis